MKQTMTFACILAAAAFLATGCRPIPPEMIASQKDPAQLTAAKTIEAARVDYEFYLEALKIRAEYTGDARRYGWAKREKKNLTDSRPIEWKGLKVAPPPTTSAADMRKALLIEKVIEARREYLRAAADLQAMYENRKDNVRFEHVRQMLERFNPVHTYLYYLEAEIPDATLRAEKTIVAADMAFDKAMKLYDEGTNLLKGVRPSARHKKRLAALTAFGDLLGKHRTSNKIGRCAFYIGQLYRHYDEWTRALVWFDRAWQWDPKVTEPTRYRAAELHDRRGDRKKAVEYYRLSLKHETSHSQLMDYARRRIEELTR